MIGFDYNCFLQIGQAILAGQSPYSAPWSFYPPAASYLFVIFGLLPFNIGFGVWTGISLVLFQRTVARSQKGLRGLVWLAFAPVTFCFLSGQIDIFFLWLTGFLTSRGWKAILAGVLLTLKPQIAFIVLPWFLLQWFLHDRRQFLWWAAATATLHVSPLLIDPLVFQKWLALGKSESGWRLPASPGVFTLLNFNIPLVWIVILAVAFVVVGLVLLHSFMFSWAAQVLAMPAGLWYENVFLIGSTPWWLLVPVSWVCVFVAYQVHNNYPFVLIPLVSLIWQYMHRREKVIQPQLLPAQA
jgi:hypothetical protein